MRAAVLHEIGQDRASGRSSTTSRRWASAPAGCGSGRVRIRVRATGLCHSESAPEPWTTTSGSARRGRRRQRPRQTGPRRHRRGVRRAHRSGRRRDPRGRRHRPRPHRGRGRPGPGRGPGGHGRRGVRAAGHPGQQRRDPVRPDGLRHDGGGVGRGDPGPPQRALRHHPVRRRALAGAVQGGGRPGVRADRDHLLGGVPRRLRRTAQLRGGQGRHRRSDHLHGAGARRVRRHRERHLPARPHPDEPRTSSPPCPAPTGAPTRSPPSMWPRSSAISRPRPPLGITGQLPVVHGGMVAVMERPRVVARFGSAGDAFTHEELAALLTPPLRRTPGGGELRGRRGAGAAARRTTCRPSGVTCGQLVGRSWGRTGRLLRKSRTGRPVLRQPYPSAGPPACGDGRWGPTRRPGRRPDPGAGRDRPPRRRRRTAARTCWRRSSEEFTPSKYDRSNSPASLTTAPYPGPRRPRNRSHFVTTPSPP